MNRLIWGGMLALGSLITTGCGGPTLEDTICVRVAGALTFDPAAPGEASEARLAIDNDCVNDVTLQQIEISEVLDATFTRIDGPALPAVVTAGNVVELRFRAVAEIYDSFGAEMLLFGIGGPNDPVRVILLHQGVCRTPAGDIDEVDVDEDGIPDFCDVCPAGDNTLDADSDGVADDCDVCEGFDDAVDLDADDVPDGCDTCVELPGLPDGDGDGIPDDCDVCLFGADQLDTDGDRTPDACDLCPGFDDRQDDDGDGVPNDCDACLLGDDLLDEDLDQIPDACDSCPLGNNNLDADNDTVPDACDICRGGDDRIDVNQNGIPDACEP
ncbi:MAG: hypothetical protein AAF602_10275 [Myxococcota bacterium]